MSDYLDRSRKLLGDDKIKVLEDKVILVIGIGGVGGTALEALARSGFKKFILIDRYFILQQMLEERKFLSLKNVYRK